MTIIIPFEEVVRRTEVYKGAEKQIRKKEAVYRGLIAKEAVRLGKSFEEMYEIITDSQERNEEKLKQEGIVFNGYEVDK